MVIFSIKYVEPYLHDLVIKLALFISSPKLYTLSHRMFGHMHGVLNVD
jgi:hypothetical protein